MRSIPSSSYSSWIRGGDGCTTTAHASAPGVSASSSGSAWAMVRDRGQPGTSMTNPPAPFSGTSAAPAASTRPQNFTNVFTGILNRRRGSPGVAKGWAFPSRPPGKVPLRRRELAVQHRGTGPASHRIVREDEEPEVRRLPSDPAYCRGHPASPRGRAGPPVPDRLWTVRLRPEDDRRVWSARKFEGGERIESLPRAPQHFER